MNTILPSLFLLIIGSIAANLVFTGHFIYGIPLTVAGFVFAFYIFRAEQREQEISKTLLDKPLY